MLTETAKTIHANCVSVDGKGLLILGASGAGKSSLTFELIALGAMLVSEQRPSTLACDSVWASNNEVHIMIEKTIAFTKPQKYKGALCLFPIPWETLNKSTQHELADIKDQFIMRNINDTIKKIKK